MRVHALPPVPDPQARPGPQAPGPRRQSQGLDHGASSADLARQKWLVEVWTVVLAAGAPPQGRPCPCVTATLLASAIHL